MSRATVYNWFVEFNRGRDQLEDESHASRPRTTVTPENIEAVRDLVNVDPHITYQEIEDILQIGSAATNSILHNYLHLRNVICRWISGGARGGLEGAQPPPPQNSSEPPPELL